jgi:hypothetical protein
MRPEAPRAAFAKTILPAEIARREHVMLLLMTAALIHSAFK